jgi:hypothetical protein
MTTRTANTQTVSAPSVSQRYMLRLAAIATLATLMAICARAQAPMAAPPEGVNFAGSVDTLDSVNFAGSAITLPDAPSELLAQAQPPATATTQVPPSGPLASIYTKYIPAGYTAQPLAPRDKFILGVRDLYSPFSFLASLATTGYSYALNGEPNYGDNSVAFGKRFGATVLRDSTEGFFTDSVMAPILHEDPRYYVEGPKYGFFHRVVYAGTRPIITRTDSGKSTLNGALLIGYAGASALSYTYYPQVNKNFHDTASTFGGSLGGAAVGFLVSEFSDQVLQALHLEKRP